MLNYLLLNSTQMISSFASTIYGLFENCPLFLFSFICLHPTSKVAVMQHSLQSGEQEGDTA